MKKSVIWFALFFFVCASVQANVKCLEKFLERSDISPSHFKTVVARSNEVVNWLPSNFISKEEARRSTARRIRYLEERMNDANYLYDVQNYKIRLSRSAFIGKGSDDKVRFEPNFAGTGVLLGIGALAYTGDPLAIFLATLVGVPTVAQLAYYKLRRKDVQIFEDIKNDQELRMVGLHLRPGEWMHIGLNYSSSYLNASKEVRVSRMMGYSDFIEPEIGQWHMSDFHNTKLVKDLRRKVIVALEEKYGADDLTYDIFLTRSHFERAEVNVVVTYPQN